ncbi:hypothetical protein DFH05DRAFT_1554447 [Lentinula detonsa]|uniref:MYND-type domain-containing protein n=1 Tax=Lentinula detonsa TaxID=2804962 RepID=A0A9W8P7M6_9AGAR|nr:hypothetical protein DFH05DRAFT_1554447 [Lentinula detonsa]
MSRSHSAIDRIYSTKSSKWTKLVSKNPARTVDALYIGPTGRTNSHGDDGEDFIFAMDAVRRVAEALSRITLPQNSGADLEGNSSEDDLRKDMEGLVNAGVVEALCRNVIDLKGDTMADDAMSSFYPPFVILYFIVIGMNVDNLDDHAEQKETRVNKRALKVIMDNWEEMSNRWWKEPQNSLKQDVAHEPERLLVSRLMGYLLLEDSSMYSKILHPYSNSLSLISRHWAYSTSASVARLNLSILRSIIFFKFSQNVEEYLKEHERPSFVSLLNKVYTGLSDPSASGKHGPNDQTSAQRILQTMSTRLAFGDPSYAVEDLGFCHDIYVGLRESAASSNSSEFDGFADALRNSETYWRDAFALMHVKNSDNSMRTEKELSVAVLNLALKLVLQQPANEVAQLTQTWVKTGLFSVLDETMEDLVRIPGAARLLTFFYTTIKESCLSSSFPLDILEALKNEFPRQRAVGAVMRYESELKNSQTKDLTATGDKKNEEDIPDAEDPIWINGLWQAMGWLEGVCHRDHHGREPAQLGEEEHKLDLDTSSTLCARRNCGKKAVSKCSSCKEFWYCGAECQKLDWKEHKPICKNNFAAPYMQTVRLGTKRLTGENVARLGLIGLGPNDSNIGHNDTVTAVDKLKDLSDYMMPLAFLIIAIAAQVFGVWDDLGRGSGSTSTDEQAYVQKVASYSDLSLNLPWNRPQYKGYVADLGIENTELEGQGLDLPPSKKKEVTVTDRCYRQAVSVQASCADVMNVG